MPAVEIARVLPEQLEWEFRGSGGAQFRPSPRATPIELDPFPGYAHSHREVMLALDQCTTRWPPGTDVTYWLSEWEETARSNAHAHICDWQWDDGKLVDWHAYVFLGGKRTPPHPAHTRAIVAHEYGHLVEDWLERELGYSPNRGELRSAYAELRGLEDVPGDGGRWHRAPGEVFADDFRIINTDVEPDWWPHPGVERPERLAAVQHWWHCARVVWRQAGRYA